MYETPAAAESAFYTAIEQKDIDTMLNVWLDSEHIVCIHPMGARLQGKTEVLESWEQIFTNDNTLHFDINDVDQQLSGKLAVHILHERVTPSTTPDKTTVIETTNAYKLTDEGWRMILHHASISPKTAEERKDLSDSAEPKVLH